MPLLLLLHPRVAVQAETATVYLDLQPSSAVEAHQTFDAATIYLDIQIISIVPASMDLVIVGMAKRWVLTTSRRFTLDMTVRWVRDLTKVPLKRYLTQEASRWKSLLRIR